MTERANVLYHLYLKKMEDELEKPDAEQNQAKLAFWKEQLDELQFPISAPQAGK